MTETAALYTVPTPTEEPPTLETVIAAYVAMLAARVAVERFNHQYDVLRCTVDETDDTDFVLAAYKELTGQRRKTAEDLALLEQRYVRGQAVAS